VTEDVWHWLARQLSPRIKTDFLPLGSTLTWSIVRGNNLVNYVVFDDGMMGL